MIPDALRPAICPEQCNRGQLYDFDAEEWAPCKTCGGWGINPDMIETSNRIPMARIGNVLHVDSPGRYVVIPLSGESDE